MSVHSERALIRPRARRSAPRSRSLDRLTSYASLRSSLNPHLERETGLEPATPSLEGWCSSHLSYSRMKTRAKSPGSPHPIRVPDSLLSHCSRGAQTAGGERRIRTSVGASQQIYSLPRLTASVSLLESTRFAVHTASHNKSFAPRSLAVVQGLIQSMRIRSRSVSHRTDTPVDNDPQRADSFRFDLLM